MKYDLIIIGMGISGISAAIYAKNSGLNVLMLEKELPGGIINKINIINNYPGLGKITGPDLSYKLFNTINEMKIPYKITEVINIKINEDKKIIETSKENYETSNIIIATGRKSKTLGLNGEKELLGKGISTCALCDGALYKNQEIALVGGGNSAIEEAIYLSKIVKTVNIIHRRAKFSANNELIEELAKQTNIKYFWNSSVTSLEKENDKISAVIINNNQKLKISGLFVYIGFEPNINFIDNLKITNKEGYIEVNDKYETKISGIYAVGDAIKKEVYQLITAASEGAVASINISKSLKNLIDKK